MRDLTGEFDQIGGTEASSPEAEGFESKEMLEDARHRGGEMFSENETEISMISTSSVVSSSSSAAATSTGVIVE